MHNYLFIDLLDKVDYQSTNNWIEASPKIFRNNEPININDR